MLRFIVMFTVLVSLLSVTAVRSEESPQEARHELMEEVRDGAKPVARMLKGEQDFDAAIAMQSFQTWSRAAGIFGDLFPEGTQTGYETEAKATIWTDREGFDAALRKFDEAVNAAVEANPQDLEALKVAAGPVFKSCKGCHEEYRVEKED
jgi:cytochrome c556